KKFDLDTDRQILFILAQKFRTFSVRGDGGAPVRASSNAGKRRIKLHTIDRRRRMRNPAGAGYDKKIPHFR
ncbi:hypothetical protein, partial [Alistipes putredinis]|uniref:hypothetical protein n=1 Tax=Alistipes putredinis TaxID=28117 RepID=UPI003AB18FCA